MEGFCEPALRFPQQTEVNKPESLLVPIYCCTSILPRGGDRWSKRHCLRDVYQSCDYAAVTWFSASRELAEHSVDLPLRHSPSAYIMVRGSFGIILPPPILLISREFLQS